MPPFPEREGGLVLNATINRYAYGTPPIRFSQGDIDQARAAGVLVEFENARPVIVDRSLYRELSKQAIKRTVEDLRSRAAEVAQETFLRAYQHLGRYDESKPFDLWVLAIARNLCLDLLRRRSRIHTQDVDEMHEALPSGERSQEEGVIAAEEHRSLESALATLGTDDREVLALYYVQKRTTKEIAQVMGVAPGTIMARLFRAREKLRRQMTTEDAQ